MTRYFSLHQSGDLSSYVAKQALTLYPVVPADTLSAEAVADALAGAMRAFGFIRNKYYEGNPSCLDVLHGGMYSQFLYKLCRLVDAEWQPLIYNLNRALHGCDLYYEVALPEILFFDHPVGSVMGRARYADFFQFSQGCTVGQNSGVFPYFEGPAVLMANATVLGASRVGAHVVVASAATIVDAQIPDFSLVFGRSPDLVIKPMKPEKFFRLSGFRYD